MRSTLKQLQGILIFRILTMSSTANKKTFNERNASMWRKVFPLWNEFKAQRELGAWLTIKLGKTRLKWQLACGEEPSLLSRSGIRPRTDTAVDKTEQNLVPTAIILQRDQTAITRLGHGEIISDVIGDVIDNQWKVTYLYMIFTTTEDKRIQ